MKAADKRISHLSEHNTNLFDVIQRANEKSTKLIQRKSLLLLCRAGAGSSPTGLTFSETYPSVTACQGRNIKAIVSLF